MIRPTSNFTVRCSLMMSNAVHHPVLKLFIMTFHNVFKRRLVHASQFPCDCYALQVHSDRWERQSFTVMSSFKRKLDQSASDDEEFADCCLSSSECEERCKQFSEVTGGNSIEAMMFLQRNRWNLANAINQFFGGDEKLMKTTTQASFEPQEKSQPRAVVLLLDDTDDQVGTACQTSKSVSATPAKSGKKKKLDTVQPAPSTSVELSHVNRITILSWNIDGLDSNNLITRTNGACSVIMEAHPDVVFLQEVVPKTWQIVTEKFPPDKFIHFAADTDGYFTAMLMNKETVWCDSQKVIPFFSSLMARKLQVAEVNIKGIDFKLITSHLESTRQHAVERKRQLKKAFDIISETSPERNVVFGGDTNLSDKDLSGISVPSGIIDVWEATGRRKEAQFTWDTLLNSNCTLNGAYKPRCRFDRMFFRPAKSHNVAPHYFELVGIQKLSGCSRFASDHWGILCHFDVKL